MSYEQIAEKFYQEHQEVVKDMFIKYLTEQEKNRLLTQLLVSKRKTLQFKQEVNRLLKNNSEEKVAEILNVSISIVRLYKSKHNNRTKTGTIKKKKKGVYIKLEKGWKAYAKYLYEQYYNIKLRSNDYVRFIDGNYKNINIKNLRLYVRK